MAFLSTSEIEVLKRLHRNNPLFERVRTTTNVQMTVAARKAIAEALLDFAGSIDLRAEQESIAHHEQASMLRLAKLFGSFMDEVTRQGALAEKDPRGAGYQRLLKFLRDHEVHLVPMTPEMVQFFQPGYSHEMPPITYGDDSLDLSLKLTTLQRLRASLDAPRESLAATRRTDLREWIFIELGAAFAACGGELAASYKPTSGRVDSPFIRFMGLIIDACPTPIGRSLKPGLADAARVWLRSIQWTNVKSAIRGQARTIDQWRLAIEKLVIAKRLADSEALMVTGEMVPATPLVMALPPNIALVLGSNDEQVLDVDEAEIAEAAYAGNIVEVVRMSGSLERLVVVGRPQADDDLAKG